MKTFARTLLATTAIATILALTAPAFSQEAPVEDGTFEWIEEDAAGTPAPSQPASHPALDGYPIADAPVDGVPAGGQPRYMGQGELQQNVPSAPSVTAGPLEGARRMGVTSGSVMVEGSSTGVAPVVDAPAPAAPVAAAPAPVAKPVSSPKMAAPAPIAPKIVREPKLAPPAPKLAPPAPKLAAPMPAPAPAPAPAPKAPRRCGEERDVDPLSGEMAGDDGVICAVQDRPYTHIERRGGEIPGSASGQSDGADIRRANSLEERRIPVHQVGSQVGKNSPHWSDDPQSPWSEMSGTWVVQRGDMLSNVLNRWAQTAGYTVVWDSSTDYMIQSNAALQGTFPDAVGQVIQSFADANPPVSAEFYVANKTVVVTTATAYDGR